MLDVANGDTDGTVAFSIAFTDDAGNAGTAVSAVTDVTAVTVDNTHPTLSTPAITVNGDGNANNADTVTLTFTSSNDVTTAPTCAFTDGGSNAMDAGTSTASGNAAGWTCTVAVGDADVNGAMGYSIAFSDANGNAGTAVTSGSGSVTIDNTHPTMTPVSIAVDNTGDANDGDDITLSFTTSEGIQTPTCTFTSGGAAMADSSITVADAITTHGLVC